MEERKCFFCSKIVPNESITCPHCNQSLNTECYYCKKTIPIESIICPHCNKTLKIECPNCKKMIPFNSIKCPYCNHQIKKESDNGGGGSSPSGDYLDYKGAENCKAVLENLKEASDSLNLANYHLGKASGIDTSDFLSSTMESAVEAAKNDSKFDVGSINFDKTTIPFSFGEDNIKSLSNSISNAVSSVIDVSSIIGAHFASIEKMEKLSNKYLELRDWFDNLGVQPYVSESARQIGPDDPAYSRDDFITKWENELVSELSDNPYRTSGVDFGNFDAIVSSYLNKRSNSSETKSKMLLDLTYIGYVDQYGLDNLGGLGVLMRDHSATVANSLASFQAGLETSGISSIYGFSKDLGLGSFTLPSIIFGGVNAITGNLDYKYLGGVARCDAIMASANSTNVEKVKAKHEKEKLESEHNKPNNSRKSTDYEKAENAFNKLLDNALEVNKETETDLQMELNNKYTIVGYTTPLTSAAGQLVGELLNSYRAGETVTRPTEEYMRSLGITNAGDFKYVNDYFDIIEAGYERRITELQNQAQAYLYLKNELKNHTFNASVLDLTKNSNFSEKSVNLELEHNDMIENYYASNPVETIANPRNQTMTLPNLPICPILIDGEKYLQDKTTGTIIKANEFNWLAFQKSINEFASTNDWASKQIQSINKSITNLMNNFFSDVGFSRDAKWSTIPNIMDYYNNEFKQYASKDEIAIFNYIVNCEDTTAALKYLDSVRTPINNRVGTAEGQVFNDFINNNIFENVRNDLLQIEKTSALFSSLNLSSLAQKAVDIVEQARNYSNDSNEVAKFFNDAFVTIFDANEYIYDLKNIAKKGGISGVEQFGAGIDNFFGGVDGVLSIADYRNQAVGNYLSTEFLQNLNTNNTEIEKFLVGAGRLIGTGTYEISTSIGNMLPSIAASILANFLIPGSGAIVGSTLMGISSAGNAWEQGFQESGKYYESFGYGALVGISEAALQYALGGVKWLSKGTSFIDDAINVGRSTPKEIIKDLLSEGKEEMIQELLDPLFQSIMFGDEYEIDIGAVIKSGVYGVISAGIMNGGSFIINTAINEITQPIKVTEIISAFTAQEFEIIDHNNLCNTPNQLSLLYQAAQQLNKGDIAKYNKLMSLLIMASAKDGIDISANDSTKILHDSIRTKYETDNHSSKIIGEDVSTNSQELISQTYNPWDLVRFDLAAKKESTIDDSTTIVNDQASNAETVPRVELRTEIQVKQIASETNSVANNNVDINNDKSSETIIESATKEEVQSTANLATNAKIESNPIDGLVIAQNSIGTDDATNSIKPNSVTDTNSSNTSSTSFQSVEQINIASKESNNNELNENNSATAATVAMIATNPQFVKNDFMDISEKSTPNETSNNSLANGDNSLKTNKNIELIQKITTSQNYELVDAVLSSKNNSEVLNNSEVVDTLLKPENRFQLGQILRGMDSEQISKFFNNDTISKIVDSPNADTVLKILTSLKESDNIDGSIDSKITVASEIMSNPKILEYLTKHSNNDIMFFIKDLDVKFTKAFFDYLVNNNINLNELRYCNDAALASILDLPNNQVILIDSDFKIANLGERNVKSIASLLNNNLFVEEFSKTSPQILSTMFEHGLVLPRSMENSSLASNLANISNSNIYQIISDNLEVNNPGMYDIVEKMRDEVAKSFVDSIDSKTGIAKEYQLFIDTFFIDENSAMLLLGNDENLKILIGETIYGSSETNTSLEIKFKEALKYYSEQKMIDFILERGFHDVPYNVAVNIDSVVSYNTQNASAIPSERLKLYSQILSYDKLSLEQKKSLFTSIMKENTSSDFYDDYRASRDAAYSSLNEEIIDINNMPSSTYDQTLSKFYERDVYKLDGNDFKAVVHATRINRDGHNEQNNNRLWLKNGEINTVSLSLISESHQNLAHDPNESVVYGFSKLNPDQVVHMYHSDAFTTPGAGTNFINRILSPTELIDETEGINEILYANRNFETKIPNKDLLFPDFVVAFDRITDMDIVAAKELDVPILLIDSSQYQNKQYGSYNEFGSEYVTNMTSASKGNHDYFDIISQNYETSNSEENIANIETTSEETSINEEQSTEQEEISSSDVSNTEESVETTKENSQENLDNTQTNIELISEETSINEEQSIEQEEISSSDVSNTEKSVETTKENSQENLDNTQTNIETISEETSINEEQSIEQEEISSPDTNTIEESIETVKNDSQENLDNTQTNIETTSEETSINEEQSIEQEEISSSDVSNTEESVETTKENSQENLDNTQTNIELISEETSINEEQSIEREEISSPDTNTIEESIETVKNDSQENLDNTQTNIETTSEETSINEEQSIEQEEISSSDVSNTEESVETTKENSQENLDNTQTNIELISEETSINEEQSIEREEISSSDVSNTEESVETTKENSQENLENTQTNIEIISEETSINEEQLSQEELTDTDEKVLNVLKTIDAKNPSSISIGIRTLESYLSTGNTLLITRDNNSRSLIASLSHESIKSTMSKIKEAISLVEKVIKVMDAKYSNFDAPGIKGLESYLSTMDETRITRDSNCRSDIKNVSPEILSYALNIVKSSKPINTTKEQVAIKPQIEVYHDVKSNNGQQSIIDNIENPTNNPILLSQIEQAVNKAITNNTDLYDELVHSTVKKTLPSDYNIKKFYEKFNSKKDCIVYPQGKYFSHIYSYDRYEVTDRLYINMAKLDDAIKFSMAFADKCESRGIKFYFKTTYMEEGSQKILQSQLLREESIVIYSDKAHLDDYIEICEEIKQELRDVEYLNPPKLTGVIDGFIGYGAQPLNDRLSYNGVRSSLLSEAVQAATKLFKDTYGTNNINYIRNNPRLYNEYLEMIRTKIADNANRYGVDPASFYKNSGG